jgi:hypothetical protein
MGEGSVVEELEEPGTKNQETTTKNYETGTKNQEPTTKNYNQ